MTGILARTNEEWSWTVLFNYCVKSVHDITFSHSYNFTISAWGEKKKPQERKRMLGMEHMCWSKVEIEVYQS